ncbi:MAG: hypothetical protein A3F69_01035 [Acidobacteria bacterium RIFCSPLOWO2_12_FULL_66_10]|nr:MAG: hypothetical protein A3F69_01035 [Acidobacteria bacterium RIFCSPLOWO2_12_FULL_66_10]
MNRTGYTLLRSVLGDACAFWCVLMAVRAAWLFRPDASGHPFVTHFFDFWHKSGALEWVFWAPVTVPALVVGLAMRDRSVPRAAAWAIHAFVGGVGACVLLVSSVDMETMRFTGGHASVSLVRMYGRPGAARDTFDLLGRDPGGPYLGLLLLVASLAWWVWRTGTRLRDRAVVADPASLPRAVRALVVTAAATALAAAIAVPVTGFRAWRLAPAVSVIAREARMPDADDLTPEQLARIRDRYRQEWREGASAAEAATWVFPEPAYPFYRTTRREACVAGAVLGIDCDADHDGDGWPLKQDCADDDAQSYPGAVDRPGDGIDQDCNGIDEDPWNVLLVVLESHRGAGVGHLVPWGAEVADATPRLDALARQGTAYTRVWANGVPSAIGFMTMNTGIEPHPSRTVARDFTTIALDGFPRALGERGYQTWFFSTATPEWDNFTFWLWRWGEAVVHQVRDPRDDKMFNRAAAWLTHERDPRKPFFATVWTRINHFPFDGNGSQLTGIVPQGLAIKDRASYSMRWADAQLGHFLDSIRGESWFAHTILIVTGDHGYPLGEHGSSLLGENLYGEATWVPLVITGEHPKLRHGYDHRPASHVDVPPTVFDLLGVAPPNAFSGHSLAGPAGNPSVVGFLWPEIAFARGDLRVLVGQPGANRPAGDEAFSSASDRVDLTAAGAPSAARDALAAAARDRFFLMSWVYERDRILPAMPPALARGRAIVE